MSYVISGFPILERLQAAGETLDDGAVSWMQKWLGLDLEDSATYEFPELSGSTSINMKVRKTAGGKSCGTFVPRNAAANPNTEIAYFNLASILGWSHLIRPAAHYELGLGASASFRTLIESTPIQGQQRRENKTRILQAIAQGPPLMGAMKAKKPDSAISLDAIADAHAAPNGGPKRNHDVIRAVQADKPEPQAGTVFTLAPGYSGDARALARQYSVLMTLDAIFEQWDRYSGGNSGIRKAADGRAQFYTTDNGGAGPSKNGNWADRNLSWFSRYDRPVIERLTLLSEFLDGNAGSYLGYQSQAEFLRDLGLYFEVSPQDYLVRMKRNLQKLLTRVQTQVAAHGAGAYFT